MKRNFLSFIFGAVFFTLLLIPCYAEPIGKITKVEGRVDVLKAGRDTPVPVKLGDPVDLGDIYRAKTKSFAEITFNNENILRISPLTRVEIKEYVVDAQRSSQVAKLYRGRVQAISGADFIKKVSALAEGNKFEVHTPNAVAGIRGTNMLVGFSQGTTVVVFLAGSGYVYNPELPHIVVPVTAGTVSFVKGEAPPSPPTKAPETLIKEAEVFVKVEKVRPEEKATEVEVVKATTEVLPAEPTVVVEIPKFAPVSFIVEEPPRLPPPGTNFTGTLDLFGVEGTISANIPLTGIGSIKAEALLRDEIKADVGKIFGTSDKGGAFYGVIGAVPGSLLAAYSAFYVEGRDLYFLTGDGTGQIVGEGKLTLAGSLRKGPSVGVVTLEPGLSPLDGLKGVAYDLPYFPKFFSSGYTLGDSGIKISPEHITGKALGIFLGQERLASTISIVYDGTYSRSSESNIPYLGYISEKEYAFGSLSCSIDETKKTFTVSSQLDSISYYGEQVFVGKYSMSFLGKYDDTRFIMAGSGTYTGERAAFFGSWGFHESSLYYEDGGLLKVAGDDIGILAGTLSPWEASSRFIALGSYSAIVPKNRYLMSTPVIGISTDDSYGRFLGRGLAIWKDGKISDGLIRALYVSPISNQKVTAGIMDGTFGGSYYRFADGEEMFKIEGNLTPRPVVRDIDPERLDVIKIRPLYGKMVGDFSGQGEISGVVFGKSSYYSLKNPSESLPFGILKLTLEEGSYLFSSGQGSDWTSKLGGRGLFADEGEGYWIAKGRGSFTPTGEITGDISGEALTPTRLYEIEGRLIGISDSTNKWAGQILGSYKGIDLDFSGDVRGNLVYYGTCGESPCLDYRNVVAGIFGGIGNIWSQPSATIKMLGRYTGPYEDRPYLAYGSGWWISYPGVSTVYSKIGGAFLGYNVGLWKNGEIETKLLAIYIDPQKNAGYIEGNLSGKYYTSIAMWELGGSVNRTFVERTEFAPGSLRDNLDIEFLSFSAISGSFTGGGDILGRTSEVSVLGLPEHNWGIWNLGMGGEYSGSVTSEMAIRFGADLGSGYLIGEAKKLEKTSSDTYKGVISKGIFVTEEGIGEMSGDLFGTVDTSGKWQVAGVGKWRQEPVKGSLLIDEAVFFRSVPGTFIEGGYHAPGNEVEFSFIHYRDDRGGGIGTLKTYFWGEEWEYHIEKYYFPDGSMIEVSDGSPYEGPWDVDDIRDLAKRPSDIDIDRFSATSYSKWHIPGLLKPTEGTLRAILGIKDYPWREGGSDVVVMGEYSFTDQKPLFFGTDLIGGEYYESGSKKWMYGLTLGGFIDETFKTKLLMLGLFVDLEGRKAGVLKSDGFLDGNFYEDIKMWEAQGKLVAEVLKDNFSLPNSDEILFSGRLLHLISGTLRDGHVIQPPVPNSGEIYSIKGENWGIFTSIIWSAGISLKSSSLPTRWEGKIFGIGEFGEIENGEPDFGYMAISLPGGSFKDGLVVAEGEGSFMTLTKRGVISDVKLLASYTQPQSCGDSKKLYSMHGLAGGVWKTKEDLKFAGEVDFWLVRYIDKHWGDYNDITEGTGVSAHYEYSEETESGNINLHFVKDNKKTTIKKVDFAPGAGPFHERLKYSFTYDVEGDQFTDYSVGSYDPADFTHGFFKDLANELAGRSLQGTWQASDAYWLREIGSISGIMGGTGDLWGADEENPAKLYFLGDYDSYGLPSVIAGRIGTLNVKTKTQTTLDDKGAFEAYVLGMDMDGSLEGRIYGIYLEKISETHSKAGIVKGEFSGSAENYAGMWQGEGSIYPVPLLDSVDIPYTSLEGFLRTRSLEPESGREYTRFSIKGSEDAYWVSLTHDARGMRKVLFDTLERETFGVFIAGVGADYRNLNVTPSWKGYFQYWDEGEFAISKIIGTKWDQEKADGVVLAYGADISSNNPSTWISIGEAKGTFNPQGKTLTLGMIGVSIEGQKFLDLAGTEAGRDRLSKLNIPAIEVGKTDLSGSGSRGADSISVTMSNVRFFRSSMNPAEAPTLWATNDVSGTYTGNPKGVKALLSGANGNIRAEFYLHGWNSQSGKWWAEVYDGNAAANSLQGQSHPAFWFEGAAAGRINGSQFTGTASGIAGKN